MIIDLILDRKDGVEYDERDFYHDVRRYEETFNFEPSISLAFDYGFNEDIKEALCKYIDENEYNEDVKDYINSVNWLGEGE